MTDKDYSGMEEEKIVVELETLHKEREEYEHKIKRLKDEEEEDTYQLHRRLNLIVEMKERLSPEDKEMHGLIDDNIDIMQSVLKRKSVASENLKEMSTRKKREWSNQEDSMNDYIQRLKMDKD